MQEQYHTHKVRFDFSRRINKPEMMDDFSITDARLTFALDQLRITNRLLGGYSAVINSLHALNGISKREISMLDVGTGIADIPETVLRWCDRHGIAARITCVDKNPVTVSYARKMLDNRLPDYLKERIQVDVADATSLPYEDRSFDIVMASLFLHHFTQDECVQLLKKMRGLARTGVLINDLHRHPVAYYSILGLVNLLPVSPMFRNDGPLSVLRGFKRSELEEMASLSGAIDNQVHWHWAFRWVLTIRT